MTPGEPLQPDHTFPPTRWSLVLSVGDETKLEELCQIYWRPIYGYLRRTGHSKENAEDRTQAFFARFLKNDSFAAAEREKGKLRTFMLAALKRQLIDEHRASSSQKRGGGIADLPLAHSELDFESAEHSYAAQPADELTPDRMFDRAWGLELLEKAHARIAHDYERGGRGKEYQLLRASIAVAGEVDAKEVAPQLGVAASSVKVMVHRLRQNFRAALRSEIADTVATRSEVDDELKYLLTIFS